MIFRNLSQNVYAYRPYDPTIIQHRIFEHPYSFKTCEFTHGFWTDHQVLVNFGDIPTNFFGENISKRYFSGAWQ